MLRLHINRSALEPVKYICRLLQQELVDHLRQVAVQADAILVGLGEESLWHRKACEHWRALHVKGVECKRCAILRRLHHVTVDAGFTPSLGTYGEKCSMAALTSAGDTPGAGLQDRTWQRLSWAGRVARVCSTPLEFLGYLCNPSSKSVTHFLRYAPGTYSDLLLALRARYT